jgi:hypothetical protein
MGGLIGGARPLLWGLAAGLLLATGMASGAVAHDQFRFTNNTDQTIARLYSVDRLGGEAVLYGEPIAPGATAVIDDDSGRCRLELSALYTDGSVYEIGSVGICDAIPHFTYSPVNRGVPLCPGDARCG